jgi:hypothetical protein
MATTASSASLISTPCFLLLYREPFTNQTFPTLTAHPYLSVIRKTPEDRLSAYSWFFLNRISLHPGSMGSTSSGPTASISKSTPYTGHVSPDRFSPFGSSVSPKPTITSMLPVGSVHDATFGSYSLRPSSLLAFRLAPDIYTWAFNWRIARSSCQA